MKQILARALGYKQEKLKSSQFQQKGYLLTPETKVPGMELISGLTGCRDSLSISPCLPMSISQRWDIGFFPTAEDELPPHAFGGCGKGSASMTTTSPLHRPISVKVRSSLPGPGTESRKSLMDLSRVTFPPHEPISAAPGNLPSGQRKWVM